MRESKGEGWIKREDVYHLCKSVGGHQRISDDVTYEGVVTINIRRLYSMGGMD